VHSLLQDVTDTQTNKRACGRSLRKCYRRLLWRQRNTMRLLGGGATFLDTSIASNTQLVRISTVVYLLCTIKPFYFLGCLAAENNRTDYHSTLDPEAEGFNWQVSKTSSVLLYPFIRVAVPHTGIYIPSWIDTLQLGSASNLRT
jgi:hypothetical protein